MAGPVPTPTGIGQMHANPALNPKPLAGRRVVLGVSGGVAAYKAVELCRRLVDAGAFVSPVLTVAAKRFVGEATFSALGSEAARCSLFDSSEAIPHTRLGQEADAIVVAPATARLIGSYAAGISSDLLTATLLATRAPVVLCPAMHTEMWGHPAVSDNMALLRRRGVMVVEPEEGRLAGGDIGAGRLAAVERILEAVCELLSLRSPPDCAGGSPTTSTTPHAAAPKVTTGHHSGRLDGVRALVTAGGTREPIDPVRFIGNRSSGKQGHAIAEALAARGALVSLVTAADLPGPRGAEVVRVGTAAEMEQAVAERSERAAIVVMAAAVADFRAKVVAARKIKKSMGPPELILEPTPDILAGVCARRRPGQVIVGFAAETAPETTETAPETTETAPQTTETAPETTGSGSSLRSGRPGTGLRGLRSEALAKLASKGADLMVANDVSAPGVGFSHDTNAVIIVDANGGELEVPLATKAEVAEAVIDAVIAYRGGHG